MTKRLACAVAVAVAVAAGTVPVAAPPAAAEPEHDIALATAQLLANELSGLALADDSSETRCMVPDPPAAAARSASAQAATGVEALAYRTDRIALRGRLGEDGDLAGQTVAVALAQLHQDHVEVTTTEVVQFSERVTPVYYVSLTFGDRDDDGKPDPPRIVELARKIRTTSGGTIASSPVYLFAPNSGPTEGWPDGPPEPTTTVPDVRASGTGAGVTVAVYDTGLPTTQFGNWPPNVTRLTGQDVEEIDVEEPALVADHVWAGHTLAIADVFATLAPGVTVEAVRITEPSGVFTDESAARRMTRTLRDANQARSWPQLIVNAFGSPACLINPLDPALGDMVPLGLEMVAEAVDLHDEALILASAGNRSSDHPYYPAAFPHPAVVSIGALDLDLGASGKDVWTSPSRSAPRAGFSNYGSWVDAWTPGVNLSTRHVRGVSFDPSGEPVIEGQALVDGTSFGPSYLGSLIAEQMTSKRQRPLEAWEAVAGSGVTCGSDTGKGVAVALTELDATATTPPVQGFPVEC